MMARPRLNMTSRIIPIIITRIPIIRIMLLVFSSSEGRTFGLYPVCLIPADALLVMGAHLVMGTPLVATLPVIAKPLAHRLRITDSAPGQ